MTVNRALKVIAAVYLVRLIVGGDGLQGGLHRS